MGIAHNEGVTPSWSHPWLLICLPALLAAAAFWPRRKPIALVLPAADRCRDLSSVSAKRRRRGLDGMLVVAAILLLIALAGPRTVQRTLATTEGITLALVVDVSGSMATPDFSLDGAKVSRLAGVQNIFRLLVTGGKSDGLDFPGRPNDSIALITFATRPETACPPTLDHAALQTILDRQKPKTLISEATTNPGDAIAWALAAIQKAPTKRQAIVFLTDGESNVPPPALSLAQAGKLAADLKIPVYAIDALDDAEAGTDAPQAHAALAQLAGTTGGSYFRATDGEGLRKALHSLDQIERDAIARPDDLVYGDLALPFALGAFACWLAATVGRATWGRETP